MYRHNRDYPLDWPKHQSLAKEWIETLVQNTAPYPCDEVILLQLDYSQPMPKLQALVVDLQMETPTATKVEEGPCQVMAISPIGQGHNKHFQVVTLHYKVVAHQDLEDCLEEVYPQEEVDS